MAAPGDVVVVDPVRPEGAVIERAAALLRDGRLVAFPTETVYGLGASALDRDAVMAVFRGKGRPATDPLIVHVHSSEAAIDVVEDWPDDADRLARSFWPGPLTLVLRRAAHVVAEVAAGRGTVAVRVPAHPVASELLRVAGVPVAAPSANRFGRVSPTTAAHVREELDGVYDLLLDGGPTPLGVESTVLDLTGGQPELLRPGGVTLESLTAVLGPIAHRPRRAVPETDAAAAPGQFLRHYAPSTRLALVEGDRRRVDELAGLLRDRGLRVLVLEPDPDPAAAAAELYARLRALDASGADLLLTRTVDPAGLGRAVNDRLFRAAQGLVVVDASEATLARLVAAAGGGG